MIKINEKLVKYNYSSRKGSIQYIVIHDTGNTSKGADANAHFSFFNSGDKQSSAHYFVDDTQILRIIKDEDRSWAVGDGHNKYGISNDNSVSVEMCINSDGDFTKTYISTIKLTNWLMDKHNIPFDKVVRHYDCSRKMCPYTWKENNWQKWNDFKTDLSIKNKAKEIITHFYTYILRQIPDDEGLNYWIDRLNTISNLGEIVLAYMNTLTWSNQEFKEEQYKLSKEEKLFTELYEKLLRREPDQEGLRYWIKEYTADESKLNLFIYNALKEIKII